MRDAGNLPVSWKGLLTALGIAASLFLHLAQWAGWIAGTAHGLGREQQKLEDRVGAVEQTLDKRGDLIGRFIRVETEVEGVKLQQARDHAAIVRELDQIRALIRDATRIIKRSARDEG